MPLVTIPSSLLSATIPDDSVTTGKLVGSAVTSAKVDSTVAVTDAGNTFTANQTIDVTGSQSELFLRSDRKGGQTVNRVRTFGHDVNDDESEYSRTETVCITDGLGSEDSQYRIYTKVGGNIDSRIILSDGLQVGAPTGLDKGAGTINAAGNIYVNNVQLAEMEEGTWTPALSAGGASFGYTTQEGYYRRVGNMVTVWGWITTSSFTIDASATLVFTGLPFTSDSDGSIPYTGTIGFSQGWSTTTTPVAIRVTNGSSAGTFLKHDSSDPRGNRDIQINEADLAAGTNAVQFTITYAI
jgi:hypothetical protein